MTPDFTRFWAGQTLAQLAQQVVMLAVPLLATLTLHASAAQMGMLYAVESVPFVAVGLFAGVLVDRMRRRPILIVASLGRALLLAGLSLAAAAGRLDMTAMYAVGFAIGVCGVFFDLAYQSYVPALVGRQALAGANGRLEATRAIAQIAGPGLGGALVQAFAAPRAILVTAVAFALSAAALLGVRAAEASPERRAGRPIAAEVAEGLRAVVADPLLRPIALGNALFNLCGSMVMAVFALYLTRELGLGPAAFGLVMAIGAPGALLGALVVGRVAARFGPGPTIVGSACGLALAMALLPLARGPLALPVLVGQQFLVAFVSSLYNITHVTLRQRITPDALLGRVNASMRCLVWGAMPLGALAGGALGEWLGVWPTLAIAAIAHLVAPPFLLASPLRALASTPPEAPGEVPQGVSSPA